MICPNCNAENKQNVKKCEWCRAKLTLGHGISGFLIAMISILSLTVLIVISYFVLGENDNDVSNTGWNSHRFVDDG